MRAWLFVAGLSSLGALACGSGSAGWDPPPCTPETSTLEATPGLSVWIETGTTAEGLGLRVEMAGYLERIFGPVDVFGGAPAPGTEPVLWITMSPAAAALAGPIPERSYLLRRTTDASGRTVMLVHARDVHHLAYAFFAFAEVLGARFFHPREELVPALGRAMLPASLDALVTTPLAVRGLQLHVLHPIEWFRALEGSTDEDLAEARQLVDWLVKTGQNHLQWPLLRTVDWASWKLHARRVVLYAHQRGVTVGVVPLLFGRSALQNNYVLVSDLDGWQGTLEQGLSELLSLGFDEVELALGEFLTEDPEGVLEMLDHAVAFAATEHPGTRISVINHVGEFENLYVPFRGGTEYFYFIPGEADARLGNTVHTVGPFDLFRPWGMYGHDDFFAHREFLLAQVGRRPVRYQPESAYWVSMDVDVPVFLPMYLEARWRDLSGLHAELTARGLAPLEGHVTFSSGHEWGYWLTDYLTARMTWRPTEPLEAHLAHWAGAFGTCRSEAAELLAEVIEHQRTYAFDRRLLPYLTGEDLHDDLGAIAGFVTHPPRPSFESVHAMLPAERAVFTASVLDPLGEAADAARTTADRTARLCRGADASIAPWCAELADAAEVLALRWRHSRALYRAVLERRTGGLDVARGHLDEAAALRARAAEVIHRRERSYRFPASRIAAAWDNPTIYKFGYLKQAHELCYWERPALQATAVVETGEPALTVELPSCVE